MPKKHASWRCYDAAQGKMDSRHRERKKKNTPSQTSDGECIDGPSTMPFRSSVYTLEIYARRMTIYQSRGICVVIRFVPQRRDQQIYDIKDIKAESDARRYNQGVFWNSRGY